MWKKYKVNIWRPIGNFHVKDHVLDKEKIFYF